MRPWPFNPRASVAQQLLELARRTAESRTGLLTVNATTPDVSGACVWRTRNTGATAITAFKGGYDGAPLVVIAGDATTTLVHSTGLFLKSRANVALALNDTRRFVCSADPTTRALNWFEI